MPEDMKARLRDLQERAESAEEKVQGQDVAMAKLQAKLTAVSTLYTESMQREAVLKVREVAETLASLATLAGMCVCPAADRPLPPAPCYRYKWTSSRVERNGGAEHRNVARWHAQPLSW